MVCDDRHKVPFPYSKRSLTWGRLPPVALPSLAAPCMHSWKGLGDNCCMALIVRERERGRLGERDGGWGERAGGGGERKGRGVGEKEGTGKE